MRAYSQSIIARQRPNVSTNYVISELVALLTARSLLTRPGILKFVNGIKQMPLLTLVHVDSALDAESWKLLEQRQDKDWSLVDTASFVIMRQFGMKEAFTSDHHFSQAGFLRVP